MSPEFVHDKDSFIEFLGVMRSELGSRREDWVNLDLNSFLEAMAAWVSDTHSPAENNPWRHAAQLLLSASAYE